MALFRIAVILFAFIPLYFGVTGIVFGAAQLSGGEIASGGLGGDLGAGALDNQFRYLCGVYIGISIMLFYSAGDVTKRAAVFRLAILAVFIGGLARLVSYLSVGGAETWQTGGMVLELATPVFVLWQGLVIKASRNVIR